MFGKKKKEIVYAVIWHVDGVSEDIIGVFRNRADAENCLEKAYELCVNNERSDSIPHYFDTEKSFKCAVYIHNELGTTERYTWSIKTCVLK